MFTKIWFYISLFLENCWKNVKKYKTIFFLHSSLTISLQRNPLQINQRIHRQKDSDEAGSLRFPGFSLPFLFFVIIQQYKKPFYLIGNSSWLTSSSCEHDPSCPISRSKRTISVIIARSLASDCTESLRLRSGKVKSYSKKEMAERETRTVFVDGTSVREGRGDEGKLHFNLIGRRNSKLSRRKRSGKVP